MSYTNEDKLKLFKNELDDIKDENLRKFTEALLINADDYFFTTPASTTGKYHPKLSLGDGGLVRHTRLVEFFATSICEAMGYSEHDRDLLIVSAIAHDIKKLGNGSSKYTVKDHPIQAAKYITKIYTSPDYTFVKDLSKDDLAIIEKCVASHMGRWGAVDGNPAPNTEFEKMLHLADYLAARKEINDFTFRQTEETEKVEELAGDYRIMFGKFKGHTLQQIFDNNEDDAINYFEWVTSNKEFKFNDAKEKIIQFLNEKKNEKQV